MIERLEYIKDRLNNELEYINDKYKITERVRAIDISDALYNKDAVYNAIMSDNELHSGCQCKMIVLGYDESLHLGSVFVFNDKTDKRSAVFLNPNDADIEIAHYLRYHPDKSQYAEKMNVMITEQLQHDMLSCATFTARLLTDLYKLWVFASKDPDKAKDPNIHAKILHAQKVRDAQLELFQKAIDQKLDVTELVPALTKLRQSTKNLPDPDTDVGILGNKPHNEFIKKNFAMHDARLANMWADHRKAKINARIASRAMAL